jgi:ADP-heptose:LPS heptosyltransferase
MIREINRDGWDCVLDMIDNDSVTTLFMSQLIGRKNRIPRIGVGKEQHDRYYDFNYRHADGVGSHIVDNTLGLLVPFGVDLSSAERYAPPHITRSASKKADAIFENLEPGLRIGFNLSAGKPNRLWPNDKASELAKRLLDMRDDLQLILIVTPDDRERGEEVLAATQGRAHLVPPGLGLLDVCAVIGRLDLLISPDTSLIHVARSYRIPVVGLYSDARKNFTRWQPYGQPDGAVVANDDDTIYDITVEQVYERAQEVLMRERPVRL